MVATAKATMVSEGTYRIVPATYKDAFAIVRLERIVFPLDAYSYLSLTSLLMWPGGVNFKAVDSEGDIVGFVAGSPTWGTRIDWIVTLGVHPDHQGRGLGRRLLTVCEEHLTQPTIRLTVRSSNEPAIKLYLSAGYQKIYVEPRYYSDSEDGIVMEKVRNFDPDS